MRLKKRLHDRQPQAKLKKKLCAYKKNVYTSSNTISKIKHDMSKVCTLCDERTEEDDIDSTTIIIVIPLTTSTILLSTPTIKHAPPRAHDSNKREMTLKT